MLRACVRAEAGGEACRHIERLWHSPEQSFVKSRRTRGIFEGFPYLVRESKQISSLGCAIHDNRRIKSVKHY